jgi:hypothetical protein
MMTHLCTSLVIALALQIPAPESATRAPAWKPARGPLSTRWTAQVDPARVHAEYPRPQMVRPDWVNLNGLWDYAIRSGDEDRPGSFDGKILVPFPVESALSGVMKPVKPDQRLWYRRTFEVNSPRPGTRWLLHFGAVDWGATVFVNGRKVGEHRGGYDPFTLDVTEAIEPGPAQELVISISDPTDRGSQPRGKQVQKPGGIMYTANTGIWQTVWIEPVPPARIDSLSIVPDIDAGEVRISANLAGESGTPRVWAVALDGDRHIGTASGPASEPLVIKLPRARLWGPDEPFLYGLEVGIEGGDSVRSYFGMRKIAVGKDESGINRLMLNNRPLFQLGPLDQGWWPDGLYTAPIDEALRYDLEVTKRLGFNMVRKHVKVEPDRWYYWCDTMGLLVWQDMPSGDNKDDAARRQYAVELERMIDALRNHPSIVMWVPFNEGWGQHDTSKVVERVKKHDPTRLVNNASGWTDTGTGDVSDMHNYPGPGMPPLEKDRVAVLGEFGGLGLPLEGHVWVDKNNWGYRSFTTQADLGRAYEQLLGQLRGLAALGLGAAVYTQTTDCEVEVNGLMTYDRAVIKVPDSVAELHRRLYGPVPKVSILVPSAKTEPSSWRFTTASPPAVWARPAFDDSSWGEGKSGFGTRGTPGAVVHSEWKSSDIWLRREFTLKSPASKGLRWLIHHDDDAEIFLNGDQVQSLRGYTSSYLLEPLSEKALAALKPGRNVLAVHCHQTGGGQYIDVGLVDFPGGDKPGADAEGKLTYVVGRPPAELGFSPFYAKYTSASGFPVVGSSRVSDYAIKEAAFLIDRMLERRPDVRGAMIRNKTRCAVMAYSERTTEIPEHSDLAPKEYWNVRARGLGATHVRPAVSCAEENLLCYPGDPYATENILIHEFGHAIHEMGLNTADRTFEPRLRKAYEDAKKAGLWKGTYAATNLHEYWAEGVQSWFDTNRENDSQHNHVNTREELKAYDAPLATLLEEVFGEVAWRYQRPAQRAEKAHLVGFDASTAPRFAWEPELLEANRRLRGERERGRKSANASSITPPK